MVIIAQRSDHFLFYFFNIRDTCLGFWVIYWHHCWIWTVCLFYISTIPHLITTNHNYPSRVHPRFRPYLSCHRTYNFRSSCKTLWSPAQRVCNITLIIWGCKKRKSREVSKRGTNGLTLWKLQIWYKSIAHWQSQTTGFQMGQCKVKDAYNEISYTPMGPSLQWFHFWNLLVPSNI